MKANLNDVERAALQQELSVIMKANGEREEALARRGVGIKPEAVAALQMEALVALLIDSDDKRLQFDVAYHRQASKMLTVVEERSAQPRLHLPNGN